MRCARARPTAGCVAALRRRRAAALLKARLARASRSSWPAASGVGDGRGQGSRQAGTHKKQQQCKRCLPHRRCAGCPGQRPPTRACGPNVPAGSLDRYECGAGIVGKQVPMGRQKGVQVAAGRLAQRTLTGCTTSRASLSASSTGIPASSNIAETVDLPQAMPPVRPTSSMSVRLRRRRCWRRTAAVEPCVPTCQLSK